MIMNRIFFIAMCITLFSNLSNAKNEIVQTFNYEKVVNYEVVMQSDYSTIVKLTDENNVTIFNVIAAVATIHLPDAIYGICKKTIGDPEICNAVYEVSSTLVSLKGSKIHEGLTKGIRYTFNWIANRGIKESRATVETNSYQIAKQLKKVFEAYREKCSGDDGIPWKSVNYNESGHEEKKYSLIKGKKYKTIKIGRQIWMAENLNYYISGCKKAGMYAENIYYNKEQAELVDAQIHGWHIPNDKEWNELLSGLGGTIISKNEDFYNYDGDYLSEIITMGGESGFDVEMVGDVGCAPCKNAVYWSSSETSNYFGFSKKLHRWHISHNGYSSLSKSYNSNVIGCYLFDPSELPKYHYYLIRLVKD